MRKNTIKPLNHASFVNHLCSLPPVKFSVQNVVQNLLVGGHLKDFWQIWVKPKSSVHSKNQLQPSLQGQTSLDQRPFSQMWMCQSPQEQLPARGVAFSFRKYSIDLVKVQSCPAFYNCLSLVPNPNNKWHSILDLISLNKFLKVQTFKLETPESIRLSVQTGE